jgi:hypothetical protein
MPGSLMSKDEYHDSANENIDEDMHMPQPGRNSDDMEGDVDDAATGRSDSDEDDGDKAL